MGAVPPVTRWECCWEGENVPLTKELREQYEKRYSTCQVDPARTKEVEDIITRIMKNRGRYESVSARTGVPWFVIAVIHNMESDGNFTRHLHNGDKLTARTVNVPAGRPATGSPPFGWEDSAVDALHLDAFDTWPEWNTVSGTLFKIEVYNGWGYQKKGVSSPYLWGASQHYTSGKFVRDGVFDPDAVSDQVGVAALLRRMADQHLIEQPFGGAAQ